MGLDLVAFTMGRKPAIVAGCEARQHHPAHSSGGAGYRKDKATQSLGQRGRKARAASLSKRLAKPQHPTVQKNSTKDHVDERRCV
jgi:hypothetical protein